MKEYAELVEKEEGQVKVERSTAVLGAVGLVALGVMLGRLVKF